MTDPAGADRSTDDGAVGAGVARATRSDSARGHHQSSSSPHSGRFRTITALLVALGIGAIVVAASVAVAGRGSAPAGAQWSRWQPPDDGTQGAQDIANFVSPFYRIDSVNQLALVTVVNLESAAAAQSQQQAAANGTAAGSTASGLQVAVRPSSTSSQVSLLSGNTIAYNLCGIGGKDCAIGVGKPSTNRLLLLRREALELALYTFKYIGDTQNVVAILPPGHNEQPAATLSKKPPSTAKAQSATKPVDIAVLFVRQEVTPLLKHPLNQILPEQVPPTVAEMPKAPEAGLVDQLTARGLFSEQLQQAQDGSSLIVLNPLPPQ
ncbi:MAG TPA: hypothetical protein VHV28_05865 [Solirubrobacteraceae bacterium]|nr:hypothetical protein [Solirubrobacteraceae bacterium]